MYKFILGIAYGVELLWQNTHINGALVVTASVQRSCPNIHYQEKTKKVSIALPPPTNVIVIFKTFSILVFYIGFDFHDRWAENLFKYLPDIWILIVIHQVR